MHEMSVEMMFGAAVLACICLKRMCYGWQKGSWLRYEKKQEAFARDLYGDRFSV